MWNKSSSILVACLAVIALSGCTNNSQRMATYPADGYGRMPTAHPNGVHKEVMPGRPTMNMMRKGKPVGVVERTLPHGSAIHNPGNGNRRGIMKNMGTGTANQIGNGVLYRTQ